jgi:hypothetical protein
MINKQRSCASLVEKCELKFYVHKLSKVELCQHQVLREWVEGIPPQWEEKGQLTLESNVTPPSKTENAHKLQPSNSCTFSFLAVQGLELRALHLLGRCLCLSHTSSPILLHLCMKIHSMKQHCV